MAKAAPRTSASEDNAQQQRWKDAFPKFAEEALVVKDKGGAVQHFRFNSAQQFIHEKLEEQRARTGMVRALILKARQQGVSTYVGARFYHRTQFYYGTNVFILTHEQDATDTLFGMVDRFWRYSPPTARLRTGAANAKALTFPAADSGYSVGTAGTKAIGRSKTLQCFHGSEVAHWPNAPEHFAGVVQGIPSLAGTEIILESTANGIGGEFHERWQQAERGEGDYIGIFVPWFWSDEYERDPPVGFDLTPEEETEAILYGLTLRKMAWRRAKISELKDEALFRQEYPSNAAESFQATGHISFIPSQLVVNARKRTCEAMGSLIIGADPARFGDDAFALAWRRGRKVLKVERRYRLNTIEGANWIKAVIDRDKPARVFIDVGNMGAGVIDILRDFGEPYSDVVSSINFGGSPQDLPKTNEHGELIPGPKNRRAEMWSRSRDWLEDEGGSDLPDDDALHADAVGPGFHYDMRQYLLLESKEDQRKRGLKSPDGWDAVALTFASPVASPKEDDNYEDRRWRRGGRSRGGASVWAG
jgi:hypothetical protein